MRTGLIAEKIGMSRVFKEDRHIPVTVLKIDALQVTAQLTAAKNGYTALQLGFGVAKPKNVAKAQREALAKVKIAPKKKMAEFRVSPENMVDVGSELSATHFVPGQFVDVTGTTNGKGFAGVMKRHNFGGMPATHGVSVSHRAHGSTGQRQDPGKTFKNKKMAGHMGNVTATQQNLRVVDVLADDGLILIEGSVPGNKYDFVLIRDAVKFPIPKDAPRPAGLRNSATTPAAAEQVAVAETTSDEVAQ